MMIQITWLITTIPPFVHSFYIFAAHSIPLVQKYYVIAYSVLLVVMATIFFILGMTYREIRKTIARRRAQETSTRGTVKSGMNREVESQKKVSVRGLESSKEQSLPAVSTFRF